MITFLIGPVILIGGAVIYGSFCERVMKPDASFQTPAIRLRNTLIELLDTARTGSDAF